MDDRATYTSQLYASVTRHSASRRTTTSSWWACSIRTCLASRVS